LFDGSFVSIVNICVKNTLPDLGGELNKKISAIYPLYQKSEFFAKVYDTE
jgi:hypothetical protein